MHKTRSHSKFRNWIGRIAAVTLGTALLSSMAAAFPTKTITIVVPFAAGVPAIRLRGYLPLP